MNGRWGWWWGQEKKSHQAYHPCAHGWVTALTCSFLGRHGDSTQLSAHWRHHEDDECALWPDLSWIFWEYLTQMNASGRRFIWDILILRSVSVQSLPILAHPAPHWCPCGHLPQQSLRRGGSWMAAPWIYTWDSAIIYPCSFQVDSILKVNCSG